MRSPAKSSRRAQQGGPSSSASDPLFTKKPIEQYEHKGRQRVNNPPVGLVDAKSDAVEGKKTYAYDPHLDPTLVWAGKAERTSFEIPTVSLHVHERIDPRSIIEAVRKKNGKDYEQLSLFNAKAENPPLREAIEFYRHAHNWSNRLVAGDSLLVMNSLLEKEGMAGQVQMIYFDPPYGIKYGSNFQPFVNKRDVKDGKDEDLTAEPEMVKAFRDTWELGLHSYLSYLRDRLLLARELLHESGSVFVQISDENVHHVREVLDEVFGVNNFVSVISFATTSGFESSAIPRAGDYIVLYSKERAKLKYRRLFLPSRRKIGEDGHRWIQLPDGSNRALAHEEIETEDLPKCANLYRPDNMISQGPAGEPQPFKFQGKTYTPPVNSHWKANYPKGMERLAQCNRLHVSENSLRYIRFADDFPWRDLNNIWTDTLTGQFTESKVYVVQTNTKVAQRCLLMTTDPGDLVLDITCGSGTTAFVAEQWGRRWITCDTSRVALALAKQRLMTAVFGYYQLAQEAEGVDSGFRYKTVPHVTLKSIANNEPPDQETLYDQPYVDNSKARVTGPFTVEAVPAPMVRSLSEAAGENATVAQTSKSAVSQVSKPANAQQSKRPADLEIGDTAGLETCATSLPADNSVARSGATIRHDEWRSELLRTGIRGKSGQIIQFARVEPLSGTRWLHADAETKSADTSMLVPEEMFAPKRVVISFGPEHAPMEQRQVEKALEEARKLVPRPQLVVFAAFQFDPEAAKDIDELNWPGVATLKAQMNADLLTEDLKKKRASNESFWLIGQPDVLLRKVAQTSKSAGSGGVPAPRTDHRAKTPGQPAGEDACPTYQVEVKGFDYYNTKTGQIESGGPGQIAVWMLDTDYDGRSLFPRQVFFPMAGEKEGWARLAKNLKAEIDEQLIEAYRGAVSLPFAAGKNRRIAVKIVDDRGIESLKIMELE